MSLHQLIGCANHFSTAPEVPWVIPNIEELSVADLKRRDELLARYVSYQKAIGYDYRNHPLYGLAVNNTSFAFKLTLKKLLNEASGAARDLQETIDKIANTYHVPTLNDRNILSFIEFAKNCTVSGFADKPFFSEDKIQELISCCEESKKLQDSIKSDTSFLLATYSESVFEADFNSILTDLTTFGASFFQRIFNSRYKAASAKLSSYRKNKKKVPHSEAIANLRTLLKRQSEIERFTAISSSAKNAGLPRIEGLETDWESLRNDLTLLCEQLLANKSFTAASFLNHDITLLEHCSKSFEDYTKAEREIIVYIDPILGLSGMPVGEKIDIFTRFIDSFDALDNWVEFSSLLSAIKKDDLNGFLDMFLASNAPLSEIVDAYRLCFYRQWIDHIFKVEPSIYEYNRIVHETDVARLADKDQIQLAVSMAQINAKLSAARPDPMLQMAGSPASIIMHEDKKQRKLKPIRSLMKEIPEFIQVLKPCFLMSPLSVSTYLPDDIQFDVTIFDEASQVFPEDAIVAIYRSKQLIVVGDSHQMPPTKFFMAGEGGDEEYDEEESDIDSYESILDLCSTTFPTKSLLCHYRSRDESLITFSNKNFYDFSLLTYPSIHKNKEDLGVDFVYLPRGVMDARTKVNILEAEKVVDMVFDHFKKHPERSLGVVAFNVRQQEAILKLLDRRRANDPSMEEFFNPELKEPFFVKNLETVQGDERDTIIFSVTYAKNDRGQFALRFGPLNLVGGERRLNVAITRAKLNVKVVSSIQAIDIDISRVSNRGPKLLHDYLDYAEHGPDALDRAIEVSDQEQFDSPFEQDVYSFLKNNGFDVTTQVGCSKYRIDIGLKRPGTSDYVLAIECDGAAYHSSRSARDRDRLRQSVLERMNWKFYRIWSTDWYRNNAAEKKALLDACRRAIALATSAEQPTQQKQKIDIESMTRVESAVGSVRLYDDYCPYQGVISSDVNEMAEGFTLAEGPLSIDYFLSKTCWIWGRERVTQNVRRAFDYVYRSNKLIRKDGFLYAPGQEMLAMRSDLGKKLGEINFISLQELRNGMYAAIEQNSSCKKEDLFDFIRTQLGFNRTGAKIFSRLEAAFELLRPNIIIDSSGTISINKANRLQIKHRLGK